MGLGGHTANSSGSSGAGRCQAGVRGASPEPEHPSTGPESRSGDRVGRRRPPLRGLGTQALGDTLSTEAGAGDALGVQLAATTPSSTPSPR